jgi:hypothetical protein
MGVRKVGRQMPELLASPFNSLVTVILRLVRHAIIRIN